MHKRLLREDAEYRNHCTAFSVAIICLAVSPIGILFAKGTFAFALEIILALATVPAIVWLAFRQQRFMNQRIERAL